MSRDALSRAFTVPSPRSLLMLHRPLPVLKSVLAVSILMQLAASGCRDLENPPQKASPEIQRQDTSPSADLRWLAKEDPSCQADGLSVAVSEKSGRDHLYFQPYANCRELFGLSSSAK